MFSTIVSNHIDEEKINLKNIFQKFHNLLGRISHTPEDCETKEEEMQSASASAADEAFITPVSSTGDLLALSPKPMQDLDTEQCEFVDDLLTGAYFNSSCDITMQEVPDPPTNDDTFIDSAGLEYLAKCPSTNQNHDKRIQSLYVKFDPLYSRKQMETLNGPSEYDIGYETGSAASVNTDSLATSPKCSVNNDIITRDKPTQVVLPAVKQDLVTNLAQTRSMPALVRSVSAIMTPTRVAIDRLINISGSTPPSSSQSFHQHNDVTSHQLDHHHSLRNILQKQDLDAMHMRQEIRELRSTVHRLTENQEDLQNKNKKLTNERDGLNEKINKLIQQGVEKDLRYKQISIVMEEYEKTISTLIGDQQREKIQAKERQQQLMAELDESSKHLTSMESSFNDLLTKYEKSKSVIIEYREREKSLLEKGEEYEAAIQKYESIYNELKTITSESLSKANETLENKEKHYNLEIARLNATIKKKELTITSLQETLSQKERENEELTKICDQLLS